MKTQFHERGNVKIIFGINGAIWISPLTDENCNETFEDIAKMRQLLLILDYSFVSINPQLLFELMSVFKDYNARDLGLEENKLKISEFVMQSIREKSKDFQEERD